MSLINNKDHYHKMVEKVIEECSYKFYQVIPDPTIGCICVNHETKQAKPDCKKCLGTGFRIKIKVVYGSSNDEMKGAASLGLESSRVIREYFIPKRYEIKQDDLFIDNNEIYYVFRIEKLKFFNGTVSHKEVTCVKKANDSKKAIDNFNEILRSKKKK